MRRPHVSAPVTEHEVKASLVSYAIACAAAFVLVVLIVVSRALPG